MDLSKALAPKSDQLDFVEIEGQPPQVYTIADVHENGTELADQQPVNIRLAEFPRVWRPSKGMLRVLADNWGKDVKVWVGRRVELYGDPNVYFGKEKRGGTRISRLSHISEEHTTLVNPRGGRGAYWSVKPLPDAPAPPPVDQLWVRMKSIPKDQAKAFLVAAVGHDLKQAADITDTEATEVLDNFDALLAGFMGAES